MARIRSVKPEFWSSPGLPADPWARLLYIAMWNWADDNGVGTANPRELLGFAFPNDHQMTTADIRRMLVEIRRVFGVKFYSVAGRPYFAIASWEKHQKFDRRSKGKYPGPDEADPGSDLQECPPSAESHESPPRARRDSVAGTGEQGNRGTGEVPTTTSSAAVAGAIEPTTQTLIGEWIERCDQRPPGRVIGQLSKEVKALIDEGQPIGDVRVAIRAWQDKGLNASTLASVLHETRSKRGKAGTGRQTYDPTNVATWGPPGGVP